jgi:hypothetical protein
MGRADFRHLLRLHSPERHLRAGKERARTARVREEDKAH